MGHKWKKVNHHHSWTWTCEICNCFWSQPGKPHKDYRMWYPSPDGPPRLMTCDESVAANIHAS